MKKIWKIIIGIVVVIALAVGAAFYFTSGIADTATAFFKAVKQKDMPKAQSYLSQEFKATTSEAALAAFLANSGLSNVKDTSWSERKVGGGRGELIGDVTTETGGKVPLKLYFVKEQDNWKIYAIRKETSGVQSGVQSAAQPPAPKTLGIPGQPEQIALVKQSIRDFATSTQQKNMVHFRGTVSRVWQSQFTLEQFNQSFANFLQSNNDFTILNNFEPIIDGEPILADNGVLSIKGRYPTQPSQFHFELKYIQEDGAWKLVGLWVTLK